MTTLVSQPVTRPPGTVAPGRSSQPLLVVVGYDGSVSSRQALEAAANLIHRRPGHLSVVFVAAVGGAASVSAEATLGRRLALAELVGELAAEVRTLLADREPRWDFRRRDGTVAGGLTAAADDLQARHGPAARVLVVVGGSAHRRRVRSVPVALARGGRFPTLVCPADARPARQRRRPRSDAQHPPLTSDADR